MSTRGSSIDVRQHTPSLHLAQLVDLIIDALPLQNTSTPGKRALPLFELRDRQLVVNMGGVMARLFGNPKFIEHFSPGEESGFIRDMELPPRGTTARVGGRLLHGTQPATSKNIERLHQKISELLDEALKGIEPATLTMPSMDEAITRMAESFQSKKYKPPVSSTATMVPVAFVPANRKVAERSHDIGHVFTAIETIDGPDRLELLCQGIANKLRKDGREDDEIEETLDAIRAQRNRPNSQLHTFLNFLDDEALSRVRLQVAMSLMDAISAQSNMPALKSYVGRVKDCFARFASVQGESLVLDPSIVYGQDNVVDLSEYLCRSTFYSCLPVWAEGSTQLFETRAESAQGVATLREVSYRFRVNGKNPQTGKSAFESRLARLHERLLKDKEKIVRRDIAELVFLYLVIPDPKSEEDVATQAALIAEQIKKDPTKELTRLYESLCQRHSVVNDIATEVIRLLRDKTRKVLTQANNEAQQFTVSLHRRVINWEAIDSIGQETDIFVKSERGPDSIAWFKYLTVSSEPVVPGSIVSFTVKTNLMERSLASVGVGTSRTIAMQRDMTLPVLPIRLVPYHWSQAWTPNIPNEGLFNTGVGVEVQYELNALGLNKDNKKEKERSEQLRSASIAAFTLTLYVILWEIQRRVRATKPEVMLSIVRLQRTGRQENREDDAKDPNTAIYAVSRAIEKALAREGAVKLQGLTTLGDPRDLEWKRRGALHALMGGAALRFHLDGSLDKVALLTYATRPSDTHPRYADADGYLFLIRTYTAERDEHGAILRVKRMRSMLVESCQAFKSPQPILEEIARLRNDGFKHIMLLSHHFGNRHIGRAAERHAPHGTLEFLDTAMTRFEDLHLYTLRRDVFPATRLRRRNYNESAFEVLSFKDHQAMYTAMSQEVMRGVVPVYTFATLAVVGDENERPQSGFCTYFYDAEQRVTNIQAAKLSEMNILGIGQAAGVRESLVSVLRAIHFMESEKPSMKSLALPVLDPFDWVNPTTTAQSGEVEIMSRDGGQAVLLSLPALLAHVTKVLHKGVE